MIAMMKKIIATESNPPGSTTWDKVGRAKASVVSIEPPVRGFETRLLSNRSDDDEQDCQHQEDKEQRSSNRSAHPGHASCTENVGDDREDKKHDRYPQQIAGQNR